MRDPREDIAPIFKKIVCSNVKYIFYGPSHLHLKYMGMEYKLTEKITHLGPVQIKRKVPVFMEICHF